MALWLAKPEHQALLQIAGAPCELFPLCHHPSPIKHSVLKVQHLHLWDETAQGGAEGLEELCCSPEPGMAPMWPCPEGQGWPQAAQRLLISGLCSALPHPQQCAGLELLALPRGLGQKCAQGLVVNTLRGSPAGQHEFSGISKQLTSRKLAGHMNYRPAVARGCWQGCERCSPPRACVSIAERSHATEERSCSAEAAPAGSQGLPRHCTTEENTGLSR